MAPPARLRRSVAESAADGYRVLIALCIGAFACGLLALMPHTIDQDTWLSLADGRWIAGHGIPHQVTLTVFSHGHAWVDEQWLARLLIYALDRLGGVAAVGTINVALIAAGVAGAAIASIRLGASAKSVLRVLAPATVCVVIAAVARAQPYAYPLFVTVFFLLARDSRRPSRIVFLSLPLLVLWGNLHGSASLGAGLVALRGFTVLWERRHELARRGAPWARAGALIAGGPLALLATPYGFSMISYYQATVLNPAFRSYIAEWEPMTGHMALAVPVFVLAAIIVWSFGRHARQTTLWERCAMLVLIAGAIIAVRNIVWFGLGTLIILPLSIDGAVRSRAQPSQPRPALNLALAGMVTVSLVIGIARALTSSTAWLEPTYPRTALGVVRNATASPKVRVFADERFADWLLWELPGLGGRVAYDASFEQLTTKQMVAITDFKSVTGSSWGQAAQGYGVLVLDPQANPDLISALRREPSTRVLYDRGALAVIER